MAEKIWIARPELRSIWGNLLDKAERENNSEFMQWAAQEYRRESEYVARAEIARYRATCRPSIPDIWRTYYAWSDAVIRSERIADLGEDFSMRREAIDAKIDATLRLFEIANITRSTWDDIHGCLDGDDTHRAPKLRMRRVKSRIRYVRSPNGTKIRSRSHACC
jgi:hypothetical protein